MVQARLSVAVISVVSAARVKCSMLSEVAVKVAKLLQPHPYIECSPKSCCRHIKLITASVLSFAIPTVVIVV